MIVLIVTLTLAMVQRVVAVPSAAAVAVAPVLWAGALRADGADVVARVPLAQQRSVRLQLSAVDGSQRRVLRGLLFNDATPRAVA